MNALTPYAAFFMRLAVGGVFFRHGWVKFHNGIPAVAGFLHGIGFPFATFWAVLLIAIETIGAVCVLLGVFTRVWAALMAVEMVVAIAAVKVPSGGENEPAGPRLPRAAAPVGLGGGPPSLPGGIKHRGVYGGAPPPFLGQRG